MARNFLERNKKKSLLALLLLFLRERKVVVLLLLLVLVASGVFLSPSSWVVGLPGGKRFAAGVAWTARRMGVDTSRWGLGSDQRTFSDLLAAFQAAKTSSGRGVGWGAFFGRGAEKGAVAPDSVGYVDASKADLQGGVGGGRTGQSVAGFVDPSDPRGRGASGVMLAAGDLQGQRESSLQQAFEGGFLKGLFGGAAGADALSGGAYVPQKFFNGLLGDGRVVGRGGVGSGRVASGAAPYGGGVAGGTPTRLSGGGVRGTGVAGSMRGFAGGRGGISATNGYQSPGYLTGDDVLAYTQLAEGNDRDQLATKTCQSQNCPVEYVTTNSGAVYDGINLTPGYLTSSDPGAPNFIPPTVDISTEAGGDLTQAQQMVTCSNLVKKCSQSMQAPMAQEGQDEQQLQTWFNQMPSACSDKCSCDGCIALENQITGLCNGDLKTQIALTQTANNPACAPLPGYCAALGFSLADPSATPNLYYQQNLCQSNMASCTGCGGGIVGIACKIFMGCLF